MGNQSQISQIARRHPKIFVELMDTPRVSSDQTSKEKRQRQMLFNLFQLRVTHANPNPEKVTHRNVGILWSFDQSSIGRLGDIETLSL